MKYEIPNSIKLTCDCKGSDEPPYKMVTGDMVGPVTGEYKEPIEAPIKSIKLIIESDKIVDVIVEQYRFDSSDKNNRGEGTIESRYAVSSLKMELEALLRGIGPMKNAKITERTNDVEKKSD